MSTRKSRSSSLQKQSHDIDIRHLKLNNNNQTIYEFKTNPESNVSKSSDFSDILKQWKRINSSSFDVDQMKNESMLIIDCKVFRTCNCIKRLIFIITYYDEWCRKNEKKGVCKGLSINDIINGLPNYNIIQLWNDFIHAKKCHFIQMTNSESIIETIQVWEYIESKLGVRDITNCQKFARNNRNRSNCGTQEARSQLYFGFTESEEIIAIQFCDIIWEFLFHSKILFKNEFANKMLYNPEIIEQKLKLNNENKDDIDEQEQNNHRMSPQRRSSRAQRQSITGTVGKRIIQRLEKQKEKEKEQQRRDSNAISISEDNEIDEFKYSADDKKAFDDYIIIKNEMTNKIYGKNGNGTDNNKENGLIKNKFVTNVFDHNQRTNKKSISFGVSFVYWDGYNTWNTYIKQPTFASLKEEMLNNPFYKITVYQWTDTLIKAMKLIESNIGCAWVAKNAGILNKRYCIRAGLPISVAHVMSILFYINFRGLQYAFKMNGCRKQNKTESTTDVKERNKQIGNWYKLFTECITLYGDITSCDMIFYHGLNKQILFDAFKPNFNCMISATSLLSIAQCTINNNTKGIIIKLQQKRSLPYGFLDVHWMSDFQNQEEKIFSFSRLDIVDIYKNQPTFQSNSVYVKSLILFQSIVKGHYFQHTLHSDNRYQKVIIAMIQNWMKKNSDSDEEKTNVTAEIDIPSYMQLLFNSFVSSQRVLHIIRSQYNHLCEEMKQYLIDFDEDGNYEFGEFLETLKNKNAMSKLKVLIMKEIKWEISGDVMNKFRSLPINSTIKGKYFHAGNDVVLYARLRRSDRDFPEQSMMFCYVEDMPKNYQRISLQWELFCKETNYHSSIKTRFLKKNEFAGYTVSNTKDLCQLDTFTFQIAVQILDIDKD